MPCPNAPMSSPSGLYSGATLRCWWQCWPSLLTISTRFDHRPDCSARFNIESARGWIPVRRVDQRGRASANFAFGEAESVLSELVPADDAILDVGDDDWMRQLFKDKGILPARRCARTPGSRTIHGNRPLADMVALLPLDNSIWQFSLRVYAVPEAAAECLDLQRALAVNVNMLLFCGWVAASRRVALSAADIRSVSALIEASLAVGGDKSSQP
jgi:hypothetical protein